MYLAGQPPATARKFAAHDVDGLVRMHRDPRVRAQLVDDLPLDEPATAQRFIAGLQDFYRRHEGRGIWCAERALPPDPETLAEARQAHADGEIGIALLALVEAPEWRFCGWFSLVQVLGDEPEVEIGARLQPGTWGGTLALDGGDWLLQRAFGELGRERVFGYCDPANRSAAHCLRVLGFPPPAWRRTTAGRRRSSGCSAPTGWPGSSCHGARSCGRALAQAQPALPAHLQTAAREFDLLRIGLEQGAQRIGTGVAQLLQRLRVRRFLQFGLRQHHRHAGAHDHQ